MTIAEYNNQVRRWRDEAKAAHGYTNKELAKAAFTTDIEGLLTITIGSVYAWA